MKGEEKGRERKTKEFTGKKSNDVCKRKGLLSEAREGTNRENGYANE